MFDIDFILEKTKDKIEIFPARIPRYKAALVNLEILDKTNGDIRKVELDNMKNLLNEIAEYFWENTVEKQFVTGKVQNLFALRDYWYDFCVNSMRDIVSLNNKIKKMKMDYANDTDKNLMAAAQKSIEVLLPVATALISIKGERITKGRAPRAEPPKTVINPNKVVKTCPCCFRQIAVMAGAGKMAHHGFERPGFGYQTTSCYGIKFPPLEVSPEGLIWYIAQIDAEIEKNNKFLRKLPNLKEISNPKYSVLDRKRHGEKYKIIPVLVKAETEQSVWDYAVRVQRENIYSKLRDLQAQRNSRQKILDQWKPGKGL